MQWLLDTAFDDVEPRRGSETVEDEPFVSKFLCDAHPGPAPLNAKKPSNTLWAKMSRPLKVKLQRLSGDPGALVYNN